MNIQQHLYDKERAQGAFKKRHVAIQADKRPRPKSKSNLFIIQQLNNGS